MDHDELARCLVAALQDRFGGVVVEGLTRLTGGASRETWSFDAVDGDRTRHALILQRHRGGTTLGLAFAVEDDLLRRARAAGVPMPEVVVDAAGCRELGDARITRRLDGETIGSRIVRGERFAAVRPRLVDQMADALARIHAVPIDGLDGLDDADPVGLVRSGLDALGVVSPAFELALTWLEANRPDDPSHGVVHGDFRIGNLIVDDHAGLLAVLDWELAHLGDPVEDLGWLCVRAWRFGGAGPVAGIGELDELTAAYRRAGGAEVTADHLQWWIIAGTLRWGLICAVQAARHLRGEVPSVELATVGRRIAENEHDVLDLLGVPAHPEDEPLPVIDHGRPRAVELVAAVRRQLVDRVVPELAGSTAYATRVAANALAIVERELAAEPPRSSDIDEAGLAARIRDGAPVTAAEQAAIRAAVTARIAVANPGWVDAR